MAVHRNGLSRRGLLKTAGAFGGASTAGSLPMT